MEMELEMEMEMEKLYVAMATTKPNESVQR